MYVIHRIERRGDKGELTGHIGMIVAQSIASFLGKCLQILSVSQHHGGTVLVERCQPKGTRVTMTLAIPKYNEALLRAPAIQFDYAGEFDHALVEFSQLLPPSRYE